MRTIATPNGEILVVLALAAAGRDELMPADVVKRILDGESKVRV